MGYIEQLSEIQKILEIGSVGKGLRKKLQFSEEDTTERICLQEDMTSKIESVWDTPKVEGIVGVLSV